MSPTPTMLRRPNAVRSLARALGQRSQAFATHNTGSGRERKIEHRRVGRKRVEQEDRIELEEAERTIRRETEEDGGVYPGFQNMGQEKSLNRFTKQRAPSRRFDEQRLASKETNQMALMAEKHEGTTGRTDEEEAKIDRQLWHAMNMIGDEEEAKELQMLPEQFNAGAKQHRLGTGGRTGGKKGTGRPGDRRTPLQRHSNLMGVETNVTAYFLDQSRTPAAYTTLIRGQYAQGASDDCVADSVKDYRDNFQPLGGPMDVRIYTALIHGEASRGGPRGKGKVDGAMAYFQQMIQDGVTPDLHAYAAIINANLRGGQVDAAFDIIGFMEEEGVKPDRVIYTNLIQGCMWAKDYERAHDTFATMREEIDAPDAVTYTLMLQLCSKTGAAERAADLLEEMVRLGHSPNYMTYNNALKAYASRSDYLRETLIMYERMCGGGISAALPDPHTLSIMANGFTEAARLAQPGQAGHVVSGIARFITLTEKYMREQAMDDIISGDGSPLAAPVDGANLGVVPGNVLMPLEERHYQILLRVLSTCNAKTVELKNRIRIIEMAQTLWMHMESVDIIPNRTTCNMLLAVYCRGGFHNSALRVLKHLFQPLQLGEGEEVPSFLIKGEGQGRKAPTLNPLEALIQGSQEGGAARPLVGGEGSDGSIEGDGSSAVVTVADEEEQAEFTSSGAQLHSWTPKTFTLLASLAIRRGHYEDCALPLLQAMQCKLETGVFSRQDEEGAAGYSIDHPTAWQLAQDHHVFKEVLEELELKPLQPEQAAELHDMMASLGFSADKQIKQAGVQGSVGAKRIAKFSRTGNVNRDKVKQWEVLEEGARLVNGDLLPRRPRHRQLDIRDQEGKDERRSGFADANAVAQA